jgi:hypothetical protein
MVLVALKNRVRHFFPQQVWSWHVAACASGSPSSVSPPTPVALMWLKKSIARLPAACRNQVRCSAFVRLSRVLARSKSQKWIRERREILFLGSGADNSFHRLSHPDYTILFLHGVIVFIIVSSRPLLASTARRGAFSPHTPL